MSDILGLACKPALSDQVLALNQSTLGISIFQPLGAPQSQLLLLFIFPFLFTLITLVASQLPEEECVRQCKEHYATHEVKNDLVHEDHLTKKINLKSRICVLLKEVKTLNI